jgi:nicotinate dehydrogenase subunit B
MAGVVAVQREHFLGVVAVAPVHARQALASLVCLSGRFAQAACRTPQLLTPGSQESHESIDTGRYVWRMAGAGAGCGTARVAAWCLDGHQPLCSCHCAYAR